MTAERDPAVEAALVSDRLCRMEGRLEVLEGLARASDGRLARLVELAEADDRRKEEALRLEVERRKASQEAEAKLVDERIEGRRWWRSTALPPILSAIAGLITAGGAALGTWAAGLWGGDR